MEPTPSSQWDTWFTRLVRLTSFITGVGLILYEVAHQARLEVMILGVAISGIPLPLWYASVTKRNGDNA